MSIEPGTYKITNVQSGLALHLSELDNKSVVANSIDDSSRQLVRIARSFNTFCRRIHTTLVAPSAHNYWWMVVRIITNQAVHWD